jgi:hypothetical protein
MRPPNQGTAKIQIVQKTRGALYSTTPECFTTIQFIYGSTALFLRTAILVGVAHRLYWLIARTGTVVALGHKVLGKQGKVIRMTQLSPDSWVLLGYRCNKRAIDLCSRGSLNAEWMSSSHNDAASHGTDYSDDNWDEED